MRSEWGARREGIRIEVLCLDYFRMGVRKLLRSDYFREVGVALR
jgi:hypothetical protein